VTGRVKARLPDLRGHRKRTKAPMPRPQGCAEDAHELQASARNHERHDSGSRRLLRMSVDVVAREVEEIATPQANLLRFLLGFFHRPPVYQDAPNHPERPYAIPRRALDEEREDFGVIGHLEERLDLLVPGGRRPDRNADVVKAQVLRHGRLFLDVVLLRFAQVHDPANTFRLKSRELLARRLPARGDLSVHAKELVNIAGGRSGQAVACHDECRTKDQAHSLHGTSVAIRSDSNRGFNGPFRPRLTLPPIMDVRPPRRSTRAPARGPSARRPCTAALASPASASDSAAIGGARARSG